MKKVNMDVMQRWIAQRITSLLGFEDDIVVGTCVNYLSEEVMFDHPGRKIVCLYAIPRQKPQYPHSRFKSNHVEVYNKTDGVLMCCRTSDITGAPSNACLAAMHRRLSFIARRTGCSCTHSCNMLSCRPAKARFLRNRHGADRK